MEASTERSNRKKPRKRGWRFWLTILGLLATAGVLVTTSIAIVDTLRPEDVPANFTRVGGPTRVQTAVEAARFWLDPPKRVYRTPATATGDVILRAAACAMSYDAPLLFMPASPQGKRRMDRLVKHWDEPPVEDVETTSDCVPDGPSTVKRLSRLAREDPYLAERDRQYLGSVKAQAELESTVVFAASKAPRSPADVAVALSLAAHLAKTKDVSLVVLPRYLGADPELDRQLRKQSGLVSNGVVVGGENAVNEDTRVVLRQILRSTNRTNFISGVRTAIGDLGALIAAIVALLVGGAAAATAAAPLLVRITSPVWEEATMKRRSSFRREGDPQEPTRPAVSPATPPQPADDAESGAEPAPDSASVEEQPAERTNPFEVDDADHPMVTLSLSGGREVSGVYQGYVQIGPTTFVKLRATEIRSETHAHAEVVLVPVERIELAATQLRRVDEATPS